MNAVELRKKVLRSLHGQGFKLRADGLLRLPRHPDKELIRPIHADAVRHRIEQARDGLIRDEPRLLGRIAAGAEVNPERIVPRLVEVKAGSEDELLFRYARLHWSIPVSSGYGRRLRFVVYDESNEKLIGILGLGDPVFSLAPRDRWIGWGADAKVKRLRCVLDAFVLGAVPPYSHLLCTKLIALLATSNEVRRAFRRKYRDRRSFITRERLDGRLALLTTTSALGRSSAYNRLKFRDEDGWISVGYTSGSGDFHFANGLYEDLREFALQHCKPTAKHECWGHGFRNRRELVRKVLPLVGLSRELVYHGVQREIFVAPLARNADAFLRGEHERLQWYGRPAQDVFEWFRDRWLLPRAKRDPRYRDFDPASYCIWDQA